MAKSVELLLGASFEGHLSPPDGANCRVTYSFGQATQQPMPLPVMQQRRELGLSCNSAVCALAATCSIPTLGLTDEEVIASVEPPSKNGTRQLLLQSLKRPDLGLTVLMLSKDGKELAGGDETWTPGDATVIKVSRSQASKSDKDGRVESGYPPSPPKPAPPPKAASAAPSRPAGVLRPAFANTAVEDDGFRDPRDASVGVWRSGEGQDARKPVEGGVGRSVMGAAAEARHAPSKISAIDAPLLEQPAAIDTAAEAAANTDEQILAAKADAAERLVTAAAGGELGDLKMLCARVGVNTAGAARGGVTPLMAAAQKGRGDAVAFLIEQGADLHAADPEGWTAVMHSVSKQRAEILKLLLQAKASAVVSGADEGSTPLHLAALGARAELVSALLVGPPALPAAAREAKDALGRTATHVAAKNGRNASLVAILKAKGRLEAKDNEGRTPLLVAAESGHAESVRILLSANADANALNIDGRSAVDLARTWEHDRVLEALANPEAA